MIDRLQHSELRWVLVWAVLIVLLASVPYMYGAFITPHGHSFTGLTHNIDDGAVYLSWMRQAADGHFFIRNLFTNEPQAARQFNVMFVKMGWFAAFAHLPLIAVFHLFRIVLGIALILGIWQFSKLFLDDERQRRLLVPLVGLSAGIGWLIPGAQAPTGSVDVWQPEAITFLSIYLNPLFLAALLLMLGAFYWLELARRENKARYAALAGLHLLVLGNVHTYDVLTVACVWTAYLIVYFRFEILDFRLKLRTLGLSALAAGIALPSIAYQFWVYSIDPIFRARANTEIFSPPILSFLEGYGLVLIGAVVAVVMLWANRKSQIANPKWLLPVVWAVVGFAVPYAPIAQQRKLVMGLHIPLCILCAYALSRLLSRLPGSLGRIVLVGVLVVAAGSNARFAGYDMKLLAERQTVTHYTPYMQEQELAAMRYLRAHARSSDTIFAPPTFSLFVPALTGRRVYYGHWSETPNYTEKIARWAALSDPNTSDGCWGYLVIDAIKAGYYVSENRATDPRASLKAWFAKVFESGEVRVYRVVR